MTVLNYHGKSLHTEVIGVAICHGIISHKVGKIMHSLSFIDKVLSFINKVLSFTSILSSILDKSRQNRQEKDKYIKFCLDKPISLM